MPKAKKSLEEKMREDYPEFVESVEALSVAELDKRLSTYAKELQDSEDCKERDEELKEALATAKEMGAPYRDVKKAVKAKSKFIIELIRAKGGQ